MRDEDEPVSKSQIDRRAEDARAFRNTVFTVALFSGVVLVNGILAILLIALLQALGLWGVGATGATSVSVESADEVRSTVLAFVRRPTPLSIAT